jgi:hypothetical protein
LGKFSEIKEVLRAEVKHFASRAGEVASIGNLLLDEKPLIDKAFSMVPLDDGAYDVFVVNADDEPSRHAMRVELTITTGPRKGEVVRLRVTHLGRDALSVLGLPGTLTVMQGRPSLTIE